MVWQFFFPVGEKLIFDDGPEFERVFHCEIFRCEIFRKYNAFFDEEIKMMLFFLLCVMVSEAAESCQLILLIPTN